MVKIKHIANLFSEREFWRAEEIHFQSSFNIIQSEAVI